MSIYKYEALGVIPKLLKCNLPTCINWRANVE